MRIQCEHCFGVNAVDDNDLGEFLVCGHCEDAFQVPDERFAPGVVIDDYIIEKKLGQGGMGVVFRALQISLDRHVALKILTLDNQTEESVIDFVREARASAGLHHQHIVQAYAVGQSEGGIYYLAMELVNGQTLKEILDEQQKLPLDTALNITKQVSDALAYAWNQSQLVHRDIKPDNIMVVNNLAKLMDLGLSRFANDSLESTDDEDSIMGTPQYISPEQLIGGDMDFRGDMYSLGATLYHFITGEFPFSGTSVTEIARKHLQEPLTPPSHYDASIPKSVCKLLEKMMAKQPEDRFQSMEALSKEIEKIRRANNTSTTSTGKHTGIHIRTKGRRKMASEGGRTAHRPVTAEASARTGRSRRISSRNIALDSEALQAYVDTSSHGKLKVGAIAAFIITLVVAVVVKL